MVWDGMSGSVCVSRASVATLAQARVQSRAPRTFASAATALTLTNQTFKAMAASSSPDGCRGVFVLYMYTYTLNLTIRGFLGINDNSIAHASSMPSFLVLLLEGSDISQT
jgi:hypothetical protein